MRFFPSASWSSRLRSRLPVWAHPQWLVTGVAVVVALAGLAIPLAHAGDRDDLEDRQEKVQGQIKNVKGEIHEASQTAAKIARRLHRAQDQLRTARKNLAGVRADLLGARRTAQKLAAALAAAEQRLVVAQANLAAARQQVAVQRAHSRDTVIQVATGGDVRLAVLSAYVESGSIEEVMLNQTAKDNVIGRQNQALVRLVATEEALAAQEAEVQQARDGVANAKKAADDNVVVIAGLVKRAKVTRSSIRSLVGRTAKARRAVLRARAADRAALQRLEKRESRIRARIIRLSRRQKGSYNGGTNGFLAKPGPGPVTSAYGYRRHPIYGYYGLHNGIDFGTGCGSPLWAGESGTVIDTYRDEVYGNRLYLAIGKVNGATMTLVYNHLSSYRVRGGRVKRGDVIGYSGMTGWSTGCHLHFTVLRNGNPVNPAPYL